MSLLPVTDAQARLLALTAPLPVERVPLVEAVGRWAAETVVALRDQPAHDLSAMDGYAIRYAERPGPWTVVGESAAGGGLGRPLGAYEAARIFTGAPVPAGADSVLIQEEATRDGAPAIDLIDGEALCDLLKELQLGVTVREVKVEEVRVDEDFFASI